DQHACQVRRPSEVVGNAAEQQCHQLVCPGSHEALAKRRTHHYGGERPTSKINHQVKAGATRNGSPMDVNLSNDDLKIIGSAITWTLYAPFYRSAPPKFSDHERNRLQVMFDGICRLRQEAESCLEARLTETGLNVQNSALISTREEVQHIIMCVRS